MKNWHFNNNLECGCIFVTSLTSSIEYSVHLKYRFVRPSKILELQSELWVQNLLNALSCDCNLIYSACCTFYKITQIEKQSFIHLLKRRVEECNLPVFNHPHHSTNKSLEMSLINSSCLNPEARFLIICMGSWIKSTVTHKGPSSLFIPMNSTTTLF
jgi:hypothetical protein